MGEGRYTCQNIPIGHCLLSRDPDAVHHGRYKQKGRAVELYIIVQATVCGVALIKALTSASFWMSLSDFFRLEGLNAFIATTKPP